MARTPDVLFVVYTAMGAVRAVGTAFRVRILETDVEVTVSEGAVDLDRVSLVGSAGFVEEFPAMEESLGLLVAGQTVRFNGPGDHLEAVRDLSASEVVRSLSWREGWLTFSGETLAEVIDEVGRYTNTEVVIVDPAIRDMRIGGVFRTGETDALLDVLETSFGIRVSRTDDHDVRGTWTSPDETIAAALFVQNVFDEIGVIEYLHLSTHWTPRQGTLTDPRLVGLEVRWRPNL